ncbi:MAG: hypothetical protein GWM92_00370, partial [Gemmatimonadetes bacterium]|nr:hypothetical protein [Gemmatimonadota bacterium]NIR76894.1 hypothetical protein [Gemmatimonadota bacterium]NIT85415.1 hypothetical protein [Gemmatimonadota bacterium]NIU29236.1 hypothetical protein [Gemmatimonadota bacterium]NIU34322.1 hypothetical protein [Gemmatimonadota bacterium]
MSLQRALLILVALVLVAGLVPAGILMDRRLESALETRARRDLAVAPRVLEDRLSMQADARMMHAKDAAGIDGLGSALSAGDSAGAAEMARSAVLGAGEELLLLDGRGRRILGPPVAAEILGRARDGSIPVVLTGEGGELRTVAVSRVMSGEETVGFVGVWTPVDQGEAGTLAALTRSDVLITDGDGRLAAFTGDSARARGLLDATDDRPPEAEVREVGWD